VSDIANIEQGETSVRVAIESTRGGTAKLIATREYALLKRKIPFGNYTEQNIVDVQEEWLYNYPSFLDFEPPAKTLPWSELEIQLNDARYSPVVQEAIKEYNTLESTTQSGLYMPLIPHSQYGIFGIDVSKKKSLAKSRAMITAQMPMVTPAYDLWYQLRNRRTAEGAKKRFISLQPPTLQSTLMCLVAAHPAEMDPISLFFDHYANYDTYFFEEANRVHNTWETELHISFYQLSRGTNESAEASVLRPLRESVPRLNHKEITRASMGFRFYGDFFDRFWTCHVISSIPHEDQEATVSQLKSSGSRSAIELLRFSDPGWQQRKVLELIQYISILLEVNRSTKEIIDTMREKMFLQKSRLSFADLRIEEYFKVSIEWEDYGEILEAIDGNLTSVIERISEWETRERDRKQEQPRWTKSDDRKYSRDINAFLTISRKKTRELRAHQAMIKSLRTSLTATQERIRNELDLRGNENIRYFTYATVVFLPLGFASSVFSMQGAPTHLTLRQMVVCAVIGFIVTVVFLMSIQRVLSILGRFWTRVQQMPGFKKEKQGKHNAKSKRRTSVTTTEGEVSKFRFRLRQTWERARKTDTKNDTEEKEKSKSKPKSKGDDKKRSSSGSEPNYGSPDAV
jgi:hypothetical protein